jgi:hypothetical protein
MSDYKLDLNGTFELKEYSCINDYVGSMNRNDKLTISMGKCKNENAELIATILERKRFVIIEKGEKEDGIYYIKAQRGS